MEYQLTDEVTVSMGLSGAVGEQVTPQTYNSSPVCDLTEFMSTSDVFQ